DSTCSSRRDLPIMVGVLTADPAVDELDGRPGDVIPKSEPAEAQAPLAVTRPYVGQLFDVVLPAHVGRVRLEDLDGAREQRGKGGMLGGKSFGGPPKLRDRSNGKARRHAV